MAAQRAWATSVVMEVAARCSRCRNRVGMHLLRRGQSGWVCDRCQVSPAAEGMVTL